MQRLCAARRIVTGAAALSLCAVQATAAQEITSAEFTDPTDRYPHAVLGDDMEWGGLRITVGPGTATYSLTLPDTLVFEDLTPRLWDVTGDGQPEVVVVQSHQDRGARLVVIGLDDDAQPMTLAATPFIGTRFRWLAPIGAADLDGDGAMEIAYVDRPHLARTVRVWRYTDDAFREIAKMDGLTNHRIGEDFITGGLRDCGSGPELVLASGDWASVMVARLKGGQLSAMAVSPFSKEAMATTLACED